MSNYKSYQHIIKLGSSEIEGILNGTVYLSYKIDGTNGCIWLKDNGELGFGSRNRELGLGKNNDNADFMTTLLTNDNYIYCINDIKKYLQNNPTHILYGEWLVNGTLKTYNENALKQFYIFDIYDTANDIYINYDIYSKDFMEHYPNIKFIPLLAKLENPNEDIIKSYLDKTGYFLIDNGLGEGIVIKNYEYKNKYGRTIWGKILTEDYLNVKKNTRTKNKLYKEEHLVEYKMIQLLTYQQINKEKNKLLEKYNETTLEQNRIFELLQTVFTEFLHDNWEELFIKKFKYPTVDFRVLKKLCDEKVKEYI